MSSPNFHERRKADVCSCGHHTDDHFDWWDHCDVEGCECEAYDGPITRWDPAIDGQHPIFAVIKKDATFT